MEEELAELKKVLRSLVVSSPSQVDVRSLMRDYRDMIGDRIPLAKFGCRDPVSFLETYFTDCFLFQGPKSNPILTLIVPDSLKHIDNFVQKQKSSHLVKLKGKRRSINKSTLNKSLNENLITKTFQFSNTNKVQHDVEKETSEIINRQIHNKVENTIKFDDRNIIKSGFDDSLKNKDNLINKSDTQYKSDANKSKSEYVRKSESLIKNNNPEYDKKHTEAVPEKKNIECNALTTTPNKDKAANNNSNYNAYQSFLKKRMPLYNIDHVDSIECSDKDGYSDRPLSSSTSSSKRQQLEELQRELTEIILQEPNGVWCTHLMRIYRNRYGRELNFNKFGFTSVLSLACTLEQCAVRQVGDDWLLQDARATPPRPARLAPVRAPRPRTPTDPEDALPFTEFDPDVFPTDCMNFMESIPGPQLDDVEVGSMLEVIVGEVYSPSHFWMIRLGERYNLAMEDIMDDMNEYYKHGEGRERRLALGAARVGHYCSSCYLGDWHRSLIVKVIDSDTVKVRHVDYGTVEMVGMRELRPLRREWAALPAQAMRARLAAVRPPASGRRWPHATSVRFLAAVNDRRLVANVVAHDQRDDVLEVLLIDTSTDDDVNLGDELVRAGHADPHAHTATGSAECYLYPRFDALESGDTPNYAEIHAYLRDGIALDYVEDYRRHVPPCLPPIEPPAPHPEPPAPHPEPPAPFPEPPAPPLTCVPLLLPSASLRTDKNSKSSLLCRSTSAARLGPPTALVSPTPAPPAPPLPQPPGGSPRVREEPPSISLPANAGQDTPATPQAPESEEQVTLSASDCEVFALLSQVNPAAAQRFMMEAIQRARQAARRTISCSSSSLNPEALEFTAAAPAPPATTHSGPYPSQVPPQGPPRALQGPTSPSTGGESFSAPGDRRASGPNDSSITNHSSHPVPSESVAPSANPASFRPPDLFLPTRYPPPGAPYFFLSPHPAPHYMFMPPPPPPPPTPGERRPVPPAVRMFFANASAGLHPNVRPPPGFESLYKNTH